jgi:hypothetical protein
VYFRKLHDEAHLKSITTRHDRQTKPLINKDIELHDNKL